MIIIDMIFISSTSSSSTSKVWNRMRYLVIICTIDYMGPEHLMLMMIMDRYVIIT